MATLAISEKIINPVCFTPCHLHPYVRSLIIQTDGICKHLCILAIFHLYFLNKKHVCSLYYSQLEKEIIHSINQHVLSIHFVPSTVDKD